MRAQNFPKNWYLLPLDTHTYISLINHETLQRLHNILTGKNLDFSQQIIKFVFKLDCFQILFRSQFYAKSS